MQKRRVYVAAEGGQVIYPKKFSKRKDGTVVYRTKKKMKTGVIGGNSEAFDELNIPNNLKCNEIVVFQSRKASTRKRTGKHEEIEKHCMRYGSLPYKIAHKIALRFEGELIKPADALKWYKKAHKSGQISW